MPYTNMPKEKWKEVTKSLIEQFPIKQEDLKNFCLKNWESIFTCKIGNKYQIGKNIFPTASIMGFFLHELIPLEIASLYPTKFRKEESSKDKDIVCLLDAKYSVEIKTSSNPNKIFGNRSYAQKTLKNKKSKSGYYLAINFEKFNKKTNKLPRILKIRFGWLDHTDWIGQTASSGQQAHLPPFVYQNKLLTIYELREP